MTKISITYVTSSDFKRRENGEFLDSCMLADGQLVGLVFDFDIRSVEMREPLEADLDELVRAEATAAYGQLRVPCIVEHAGLLFDGYVDRNYPGGLTKPMWNTLGSDFLAETRSAGRRVIARAVVGYCDGKTVHIFRGETNGTLAEAPRGDVYHFYWDTVFIPDCENPNQLTYSQIVEQQGLSAKVGSLSQSTKAMLSFLEFRRNTRPELWPLIN